MADLTLGPDQTKDLLKAVAAQLARGDPTRDARRMFQFLIFRGRGDAQGPNPDWAKARQETQSYMNDVWDRGLLEGRPRAGDWYDALSDGLYITSAIGHAAAFVGPAGPIIQQGFSQIVGLGQDLLHLSPVQDYVRGQRANAMTATKYEILNVAKDHTANILEWVASTCGKDANCAAEVAHLDPDFAKAAADYTPAGVIKADTTHQIFNTYVYNSVQDNGDVLLSIDQLKQSVTEQFGSVQTQMSAGFGEVHSALTDIDHTLGELKAGQGQIINWIDDQTAQQKAAARAAECRRVTDLSFQAASSTIGAVAAIVNLFDPKLSSDISKVGNAGLQVLQAGQQLVDACSLVAKELDTGVRLATALGSAAATGNFIAAAFQIVGLFAPSGPTPEQLILQEVGALKEQMSRFQSDVAQRFDRVDRELNAIYTGVMNELDHVEWQLGRLNDSVDHIQLRLANLAVQLAGLEEQMLAYFKVVERGPLNQKIDDSLSRAARGLPMSGNEYAAFEAFFHEWASFPEGEVWQAVEQPVVGRFTDDEHLAAELAAPISQDPDAPTMTPYDNLSFVKRALVDRGLTLDNGTPLPNPQLPNPQTWALVAASYSQLQAEWPQYAQLAPASTLESRRNDVRKGGQELTAYLRTLLSNRAVFQALLGKYGQRLRELGQALDAEVHDYMMVVGRNNGRQDSDPVINVWLDAAQDTGFRPLKKMHYVNLNQDLDLPGDMLGLVPQVFWNADWFTKGVGQVTATIQFVWEDAGTIWRAGEPIDQFTLGVYLDVSYKGVVVARKYAGSSRKTISTPDLNDPANDAMHTDEGRNLLSQMAAVDMSGPGLTQILQNTAALVNQELQALRPLVYDNLSRQCAPGGKLQTAASRVTGARSLLDTVITLAFERVRSGDDLLRVLLDGALAGTPAAPFGYRLPDLPDVLQALRGLSPNAPGADNLFGSWITAFADPKSQLLGDRLAAWQDLHKAGKYDEWYLMAEQPQLRLDVASTIVELTAKIQPGLGSAPASR